MFNPHKSGATLLSKVFVSLVPISMVAYRLIFGSQPSVAELIFRPVVLVASFVLCFLLCYGSSITISEKKVIRLLAIFCGILLIPSLAAVEPMRALQEWLKLVLMCMIAVMLCRPLRHVPTAKVFGLWLVIASAVIGALILSTYLNYMGPVLPGYEATRIYKETVFEKAGIPLNPAAFECVFSYISGMCLLRSTKLLWFLGFVLLLISSTLTGSRAPLAVFLISGLVLIVFNALKSPRLLLRLTGWLLAAAMVMGTAAVVALPSSQQMSSFTEGRWELWSLALHKFAERPMLGNGYLSAEDDPGFISGGYHNEFVTALAEQGVIGSIAVISVFVFLFRYCWKLAFDPSARDRKGHWVLFGCLFLFVRALVELPGLFGTAQAPADFLAYIFLAIVISKMSRKEDLATSSSRLPVSAQIDSGGTVVLGQDSWPRTQGPRVLVHTLHGLTSKPPQASDDGEFAHNAQ